MTILDKLNEFAGQIAAGRTSDEDVQSTYDQVAHQLPQGTLADGISHTFKSDQTPPFEQMLGGLFNRSNPDQKAGILNQILGALGPNAAALLGQAGLGGLAGTLSSGQVTPQQAQQIPSESVQVLAQHAAQKDPTLVDRAAAFYSQHPTLVKAIGAGALALLLNRMSRR